MNGKDAESLIAEGFPYPGHPAGSDGRPLVACFGETMAQLSPLLPGSLESADALSLNVAGAESTVALYLAHLGHRVAWVSRLGMDPFGARIKTILATSGVDTHWVDYDPDRSTGVYFKDPAAAGTAVYYYRAGSAASAMSPLLLSESLMVSIGLVHITGITPALSTNSAKMTSELFRRRKEHSYTISFDVNHRPQLWGDRKAAEELLGFANQADLVFVGLDEAEALWGTRTAEDVRALINSPAELIVKDGAVGATAFTTSGTIFEPACEVEVVEPVGAGDSFAAGYIHEKLSGSDHHRMLQTGHRFAAAALRTTADFVSPEEFISVTEH
jgi:2-dehydro-3-deoxygluconokinase